MSTSVGMTRTENVTGKSVARYNVIKLVFGPQHAKGCRPLVNDLQHRIIQVIDAVTVYMSARTWQKLNVGWISYVRLMVHM